MRAHLAEAAAMLVGVVFPPDPGLLRLLAALRATLAGLLTFLLVMLLGAVLPPYLAPSLPDRILGFAIGLFAGAAVRDPTGRQRALTLALVPPAAFAACIAAALLLDHALAAELLVPAVMFAVTYGGARGPRWGALGTIALISYIISLVTRRPPSELPAQALVVCLGAADAAMVRFVLLRERPAVELARLRHSIRHGISGVLGRIDAAVEAGAWGDTRATLYRELDRLGEAMLMGQARVAAMAPRQPEQAGIGLHMLEIQLAVEHLARVAQQDLGQGSTRRELHRKVSELRQALAADLMPPRLQAGPSAFDAALALLARVMREPIRSEAALQPAPRTAGSGSALRPAVQAAIAGGLAIGCGELVSPHRWYWAAFAAFVMFQGTRSRGESIAKVAQFIAGTLAGVLAGVLLATALAGRTLLMLAAIVAAVFLAFQAFMAAYAVMIFWITVVLGLMFGMLGYFAPELLLMRLEETAAGAACGILVTSLVLVRPTRAAIDVATAGFLRALGAVVDAALPGLLQGRAMPELPARLLEIEQRLRDLRAAAQPALAALGGWRDQTLQRRLVLLSGCETWARELGAIALHSVGISDVALSGAVRQAGEQIDATIARLLRPAGGPAPPAGRFPQIPDDTDPLHRAVRLVLRIEAALAQLAGHK